MYSCVIFNGKSISLSIHMLESIFLLGVGGGWFLIGYNVVIVMVYRDTHEMCLGVGGGD